MSDSDKALLGRPMSDSDKALLEELDDELREELPTVKKLSLVSTRNDD